jgi:hypothetical protein
MEIAKGWPRPPTKKFEKQVVFKMRKVRRNKMGFYGLLVFLKSFGGACAQVGRRKVCRRTTDEHRKKGVFLLNRGGVCPIIIRFLLVACCGVCFSYPF